MDDNITNVSLVANAECLDTINNFVLNYDILFAYAAMFMTFTMYGYVHKKIKEVIK